MKKRSREKNPATSERKRPRVRLLLVLYDFLIFAVCQVGLFWFYQGAGNNLEEWDERVFLLLLCGVPLFVVRFLWKIYQQMWRYGGIQSYIRLICADACAFLIAFPLVRIIGCEKVLFIRLFACFCTNLLLALTIRMFYRYIYKCGTANSASAPFFNLILHLFAGRDYDLVKDARQTASKIRIAIVGAGRVGVSLAEDLLSNASSSYYPVCFIDSSTDKIGRQIHGIPIYSDNQIFSGLLTELSIQECVFAVPGLDADDKKRLFDFYSRSGCKIKVYDYPTMQNASGKRHLREFDPEELLFRKPLNVVDDSTKSFYQNKVVMITGGGGSIGSELCRQIAQMSPKKLVILDVYENGAYDIQQDLSIRYGKRLDIAVEICSVANRHLLEKVFERHHPDLILHAAAHKHVPLMERNCCEAVENNVFGTLNVVELAEKYHVGGFIMISTDKAVNPTNIMGATKRMCEMIVLAHGKESTGTRFSATRFGNVLGSAGSVIPLFKKQIMNGGPVTLTDKRIIRYFMTIPEASQLVLKSGAMAKNGELFVLDMGKPVKILDLAENMIRLSGFEPYKDIDIREIGLRPGEKLYEELLIQSEELDQTSDKLIFVERDKPITMEELANKLSLLRTALETDDDDAVRRALYDVVPTFKTKEEVNQKASESKEMLSVAR